MATQIKSDAVVSDLGQRAAISRKLGGNRQLRGMAIIGALLLALGALAVLAVVQLRPGNPAVSASDPKAVAALWTGTCRAGTAGCVPEEDFAIPVSAPAVLPAAWTGTCRAGTTGCVPEEDFAPVTASPAGTNRQQARLYAIELRDYGQDTTEGDSGPCRTPGRSCNR